MRVAVGSIFRDSTPYLATYYQQLREFGQLLAGQGSDLRIIACENDSTDGTYESLYRNLVYYWPKSNLARAHDDCPYYSNVDLPERWRHIAWVCNKVLDLVDKRDDVFLYVESDLRWNPLEMMELVDLAVESGAVTMPAYAHVKGGRYYDTWGSRIAGAGFTHAHPYHPAFVPGELIEMESCASVLAVRTDLLPGTRFSETDCFRGWSEQIREANNGSLLMATDLGTVHP